MFSKSVSIALTNERLFKESQQNLKESKAQLTISEALIGEVRAQQLSFFIALEALVGVNRNRSITDLITTCVLRGAALVKPKKEWLARDLCGVCQSRRDPQCFSFEPEYAVAVSNLTLKRLMTLVLVGRKALLQ